MTRKKDGGGSARRAVEPRGGGHRRADRVAAELQKAISTLLLQRTKDPRLEQVTVTAVRVTPDLRLARVYFTLLDDRADRSAALEGLEHARPFLRRHVALALALRYAPDLAFAYDSELEGARRIDALLRDLHPQGGEPGRADAGEVAHEPSGAGAAGGASAGSAKPGEEEPSDG